MWRAEVLGGLTATATRSRSGAKGKRASNRLTAASRRRPAPFWTLVVDYRGGTHVWQTHASDPDEAMHQALPRRAPKVIPGVTLPQTRRELRSGREFGDRPVRLNHPRNVFCHALLVRGKLMLVNVVLTDPTRVAYRGERAARR